MWRGPVVGPALRKRACPARPDKPGGRGRANSTPRHPAGGGEGGITPALGVIGDRISAANGRAMFYTRFFDWCEARRLALDVFGDAPALDVRREHVRYWPCERVPGDIASWEGPHGIARRPFLALRDDDASPAVAGELAQVTGIAPGAVVAITSFEKLRDGAAVAEAPR